MKQVVAIDGPAASGKSSAARILSERLRFSHANTGAMYRAVTLHLIEKEIDLSDAGAVHAELDAMEMGCELNDHEWVFLVHGRDLSGRLGEEKVAENVSTVASIPEVRRRLVELQRSLGEREDLVMEGRDIGTVVFPHTPHKFYIDASPEIRARRRAQQGLKDAIDARDRQDTMRRDSPLTIATDALVIDSSEMSIDAVVGQLLEALRGKGLRLPAHLL